MINFEDHILKGLLTDDEYVRKTLPYLKEEYFTTLTYKILFSTFKKYYEEYNSVPSIEAFCVDFSRHSQVNDRLLQEGVTLIHTISKLTEGDRDWLVKNSEKWCRRRAMYNAIHDTIELTEKEDDETWGSILDNMTQALGVSFDSHIGHDYFENASERYEYYNSSEDKIPFDLDYMNRITKGGLPRKTLAIAIAGTNVGKSLFMCHYSAASLLQGYNVLYITLEMAEEKISQRIDANLFNLTIDEVGALPKEAFEKKVERVRNKTQGRLIVKEYPTACAHVGHFRHLINELKIKQDFKPDVICVDYLNICASARSKMTSMYEYNKAIAEELRSIAVEHKVVMMTATQVNREGFKSSDIGLEDTSESFGIPATADFMFAITQDEALIELCQFQIKQLKNRFGDPHLYRKHMIGVDKAKQKLYDVEQSAQEESNYGSVGMAPSSFDEPPESLLNSFESFK